MRRFGDYRIKYPELADQLTGGEEGTGRGGLGAEKRVFRHPGLCPVYAPAYAPSDDIGRIPCGSVRIEAERR
jgi:hypothetical protein